MLLEAWEPVVGAPLREKMQLEIAMSHREDSVAPPVKVVGMPTCCVVAQHWHQRLAVQWPSRWRYACELQYCDEDVHGRRQLAEALTACRQRWVPYNSWLSKPALQEARPAAHCKGQTVSTVYEI